MKVLGVNIIGNDLSANGEVFFEAINPSTGESVLPQFREATVKEVDEAVRKACLAFDSYSQKNGEEKALLLDEIGKEILLSKDILIDRAMEESGLPQRRLDGELNRTVNQLKLFAELLREGSWLNARIDTKSEAPGSSKPDIRSMEIPLGPVGIFGSSNFPFAFSVAGGDSVSALAAGCPVIFKGHPSHPGTCEIMGRLIISAIQKVGMPEGTFSLVQGKRNEIGLAIVRHPSITAIGFTGSLKGGRTLFDEASRRSNPIPVYAEMGSVNPVFILPHGLELHWQQIAKDLTNSINLGVGQFCTNPGLLVIKDSDSAKKFQRELKSTFEMVNSGVMLNSKILENYESGLKKQRGIEGVNLLAEGKHDQNNRSGVKGIARLFQTDLEVFLNNKDLSEEVFGPSSIIISSLDKRQIIDAAKSLRGQLTATIIGNEEDFDEYRELFDILKHKVGRLIINGMPTGVAVTNSMVHGGPYPATTDSRSTSVGTQAIHRFTRPVCYQNFPQNLLPEELKDNNPLSIWRLVDGKMKK